MIGFIHVIYVPTQEKKESEISRIFSKISNENRQKSSQTKTPKGQKKTNCLIWFSMLHKKNRADIKAIEKIFKEGKFLNSAHLTFKFLLSDANFPPRISFIAPKSIAKLATSRNLLRRRGYRALEKHITQFPLGLIGAFVFKKREASPIGLQPREDISTLENEIKNILSKIN